MTDDRTIPSRSTAPRGDGLVKEPPALLGQYFAKEIDLDRELTARFGTVPLLSQFNARVTGTRVKRATAMLHAQDGAVSLRVEMDASRSPTFTFTMGGMLGLGFMPTRLSDMDRAAWVRAMRAPDEPLVFLWGPLRWEQDYLLFSRQKHFTTVFAFSARQTEAAARLTHDALDRLVAWLEKMWG
jgi:hypothetical protein